jgi:hypothetical protein
MTGPGATGPVATSRVGRLTLHGVGRFLSAYRYGGEGDARAVVASAELAGWGGAIAAGVEHGWSVTAIDLAGAIWDEVLDDLTRAFKFLPGTGFVAGDGLAGCALATVVAEQRIAVSFAGVVDPPSALASDPRWVEAGRLLGDRLVPGSSVDGVRFPEPDSTGPGGG